MKNMRALFTAIFYGLGSTAFAVSPEAPAVPVQLWGPPSTTTAGTIYYWNGTAWAAFGGNTTGTQYFSENASGAPAWGAGGGGTPGGSNSDVQFNSSSSFGGNAGFTYDGTSVVSLGVAGTSVGAVTFNNATSGSIILQPTTGALGTVRITLPDATGTLPLLSLAQTWSAAQTFNTSDLVINGGSATAGLATVTAGGVVSSEANATVAQGGTNCVTPSGTCLDNITLFSTTGIMSRAGAGSYTFNSLSSLLDTAFGTTQGSIIYRGASTWAELTPGTSGFFLETQGASANPTWAAASGGSGCSTGGSAGNVLTANGSGGCTTDTVTSLVNGALGLGSSGTAGSVAFGNATSGVVTLQPITGALGTVTASLPANTGTIDELNLVATFTAAKTFTNSDLLLLGSSTGATTFTSANASATNYVATVPANTGTIDELNLVATFTATKTFTNSDLLLLGSSTGATTFMSANASATNYVATVPANTGTLAELNIAQTWAAAQTFDNSDILLLGSSTGATTFTSANASATNYVATIPANTGTLAELNLAQTFTATQTFPSASITNAELANSTISGIALGSNLDTLTISSPLTGTSYNGSAAVSIGCSTCVTGTGGDLQFPLTVGGTTTSGGIPYFASTTSLASSGLLGAGQIVIGGGAGTAPSSDANATLSAGALSLGASGTAGSVAFGNATSGTLTLAPVTGALGTVTASFPANTGVVDELNLAQTFTAAKTFTNSDLLLLGSSTGATTFTSANASASAFTITVPAATDTMALLAATQTLTNKTISGSSNTLSNIALSSLATQTANTVVGALSATTPSALAVPSCSGASNALTWTSGTGFGCNTISASGLAFPVTVSGTTTSGGLPYFSSTTVLSSSGLLGASQVVLGGGAGSAPTSDANATLSAGTFSLGASGTAGSVVMGNATSGTITLAPVTGALGTVTASLPANTGTIAETNINNSFSVSQTLTGDTTSATSPGAGKIGEVMDSGAVGPTSLTSTTPKSITSLSVTAGHWDCYAAGFFIPAGSTTTSQQFIGVSLTNNAFDAGILQGVIQQTGIAAPAGNGGQLAPGARFLNLTATTTVYAIAEATFAVSTMQVDEELFCRRMW